MATITLSDAEKVFILHGVEVHVVICLKKLLLKVNFNNERMITGVMDVLVAIIAPWNLRPA